ncbi:MAG: DUF723 domain-containing protein [Campylobacteraceae bacterium]|nr:DUF723 domain-containing protein [Campylobacteraceae bacterium]
MKQRLFIYLRNKLTLVKDNNIKKSITNNIIDERLKANTKGTIRISDYVTGAYKTTFQCNVGHQWDSIYNSVTSGKNSCPVCRTIKGLRKESKYYLYYFKALDDNTEYKVAYKIGVTYMDNDNDDIFSALYRRYTYEYSKIREETIQYLVYDTPSEAAYIEYQILKINQVNRITRKFYINNIFSNGRSEIFKFDILRNLSLEKYIIKHKSIDLLKKERKNPKRKKKKYTVKEKKIFLKDANDKFNNKFDYTKSRYLGKYTKTTIICPLHGRFRQSPLLHLKSIHGCNKCHEGTQRRMTNEIIDKKLLQDGREFIRIGEVVNAVAPILFKCKNNHEWSTLYNSILGPSKSGCLQCYHELRKK